jgi:hypothetical protein
VILFIQRTIRHHASSLLGSLFSPSASSSVGLFDADGEGAVAVVDARREEDGEGAVAVVDARREEDGEGADAGDASDGSAADAGAAGASDAEGEGAMAVVRARGGDEYEDEEGEGTTRTMERARSTEGSLDLMGSGGASSDDKLAALLYA